MVINMSRERYMDPQLLTINDGVRMTNIGRSTLYQELLTGRLESVKIGRRRLIPRQALIEFVEQLRQKAREEHGLTSA